MADQLQSVRIEAAVREAISVLQGSERGRHCGANLLRFFDEGGTGLDAKGTAAVRAMLDAVSAGYAGTVLWSLDDAFGKATVTRGGRR